MECPRDGHECNKIKHPFCDECTEEDNPTSTGYVMTTTDDVANSIREFQQKTIDNDNFIRDTYLNMLNDELFSQQKEWKEGEKRGWPTEVMLIIEGKIMAISRIIKITNNIEA